MPAYVHRECSCRRRGSPVTTASGSSVTARLSLSGRNWHAESGVQVVRMILSGTFDRYPGLQVIVGHRAGMVPFQLRRMDDAISRTVTGLSRSITGT